MQNKLAESGKQMANLKVKHQTETSDLQVGIYEKLITDLLNNKYLEGKLCSRQETERSRRESANIQECGKKGAKQKINSSNNC
jgi:hypothetical protein